MVSQHHGDTSPERLRSAHRNDSEKIIVVHFLLYYFNKCLGPPYYFVYLKTGIDF